jgi:hypothetical protein
MQRLAHSRPIFTIRPGMTDREVTDRLRSHVILQPADVTWCDICERYVKADHACTATLEETHP